jgi:hypothetical protein
VAVRAVTATWAARQEVVAVAAMVLRRAAPVDEPSWLAVLLAAAAAPVSPGSVAWRLVWSIGGPPRPVSMPSMIVAAKLSGKTRSSTLPGTNSERSATPG